MNAPADTATLPPDAIAAPDPAELIRRLAEELGVRPAQIAATVELLDGGATVPFVARYRKEVTGGLDDTVLRNLEVRLDYLRDLDTRRLAILQSIAEQGKLTPELHASIQAADTKQRLEDLYTPYKPKRRTRAQIAREAGLEPLADRLLAEAEADPQALAADFVNADAGVADVKAALDGARDILTERFAEDADVLEHLREFLWKEASLRARVIEGKEGEGANFRDWFDFSEALRTLPSHRILALLRGRQQGVLDLRLSLGDEREAELPHPCVARLAQRLELPGPLWGDRVSPRNRWLAEVCRWTWRVKLLPGFETELIGRLRENAEAEAIRVFGANLKDLLLAAPAGPKAVLGLDPGIRTGVKVAAIDATGKLLDTTTIYPHEPRRDWDGSIAILARLAKAHRIGLIAIGNGTASRETEKLAADLMKRHPELNLQRVVVSEAGASVYSASETAATEFPDLDVSLRGAVSIARRLQDPLAELVKIDPKAIGVGQYQHDVNQRELARALEAVVEDCVNAVGVDVNTASAALLARVSGLTASLARNIVSWRDTHGAYQRREDLKAVPRFGEKSFEQAAGFLRIPNGADPLDASAVHPEAYPVVERILASIQADVRQVLGNREALKGVAPSRFVDDRFGLPTIQDILQELEKPGRDPRPEFKTAQFRDGIETLADLQAGMVLEGVVTNVANFGAFVDIGVHQDGLVHISALSNKFVDDPRDVVRVGQTVQVKVVEVDQARKRVALTMRLDDDVLASRRSAPGDGGGASARGSRAGGGRGGAPRTEAAPAGAMAAAFAKLKQR
ncbi:MAG: Tex family protein [Pigmentiphaga sp.]